jgi:hypothetical protein
LLQHLAFDGTPPAYCAAHLDLGVTIRLQHGLGHVAQKMIDAIPMRDPGKLGRDPGDERVLLVRQPQVDRQTQLRGPCPRLDQQTASLIRTAGEQRLGKPHPFRVQLPHPIERFMAFLWLQAIDAQDQGVHVPIRRR